jgi:hypothetical protein
MLLRQGEEQGDWAPGPSPYETAAILNGSVSQVIITSLLFQRPRDLPAAAASIIDRTLRLLEPAGVASSPSGEPRRSAARTAKPRPG